MDGSEAPIWFLGDLEDAWACRLLKSTQSVADVWAVSCREGLPDGLLATSPVPQVLVLHRSRLSLADVSKIEGWRTGARSALLPRVLLCYGPFVRHAELERCGRVVDLMLPEATAGDTLPGQLRGLLEESIREPAEASDRMRTIDVISTEYSLREVLCEACTAAGHRVAGHMRPELDHSPSGQVVGVNGEQPVIIWDVPVLEAGWPESLSKLSRKGPVVALLGFADRATVEIARERGAAVCLDMPLNLVDLYRAIDALDGSAEGTSDIRGEAGHHSPFRPIHVMNRGRDVIRNREPRAARVVDRKPDS